MHVTAHETMIRSSATLIKHLLSMSPCACAREPCFSGTSQQGVRRRRIRSAATATPCNSCACSLLDVSTCTKDVYAAARLPAMSELMYSFRRRCRCPRPSRWSSHVDAAVRPRGRHHAGEVLY